ncbi:EAL and HDOD domain-containing protein [Sulfurimonas sp.]|uniref:EAL and HDOD domain-containing protein n=1 Tax=Sulfurimonas sp. TaxID=2022749 RepID=UPI002B45C476|nr:EAL domain-containing protein [Sulfurimonas sp.]
MKSVYIGRQPILDNLGKLSAYEILYRDGTKESNFSDDRFASASVISSILNKFGTAPLLGGHSAFIKIGKNFLLHDIIFDIPKDFFIFSIFENIEVNERIVERVQQLQAKGYKLAINDISLDANKMKNFSPIFKELSYIKINLNENIDDDLKTMIDELRLNKIKIIGSKIENNEKYELAKSIGCDFFQGYFFAKPKIIENAKFEPFQANVLKLYNLLINDTNIDEITSEFEKNYEITIQLLRYMNSAMFHFKKRISSIHHVLTLMGRQPLAKWLMLMIYSKSVSKDAKHSPLMLMVKSRTELMENILIAVKPDVGSNILGEAYFIGVLSLLDTLFGVELEKILREIHVSEEVVDVLLRFNDCLLSDIYTLVIAIEEFDILALENFSKKYEIEPIVIKKIIIKSIENVNKFEKEMI